MTSRPAAKQFRAFRKSTRMTQRMLALCLGISRRSVISIETGKHQPSILHWIEFEELVKRHKEKTP